MEGRSGTGKLGIRYYYYRCKNLECKFKVPADEIERVVIERIKMLSSQDDMIDGIITGTNKRLQKELPQLKEQKKLLQEELDEIRRFADGIMNKWTELADEGGNLFLNEKLEELGKRRKEIETGIESLELMIVEIERESVGRELVMLALNKFTEVFNHIQPHRQKDLVRHVLHKAVLSNHSIKIALYGRPPTIEHFSPTRNLPRLQTATRPTKTDFSASLGAKIKFEKHLVSKAEDQRSCNSMKYKTFSFMYLIVSSIYKFITNSLFN